MNYSLFEKYPELFAFSTEREGGVSVGKYASLNLCDYTGDELSSVKKNRQIFCKKNEIVSDRLFMPHQIHGSGTLIIDEIFLSLSSLEREQKLDGVDALMTNQKGVCIGVSTADCVPIMLFDSKQKVIATVHAGWRGTLAKIVVKTLEKMQLHFGSSPTDILVQIAPCISFENYEVGVELVDSFAREHFPINQLFCDKEKDKFCFDLKTANCFLLLEFGVLPQNIAVSDCCTFRDYERFFSARRLGINSGRMFSCMMLRR